MTTETQTPEEIAAAAAANTPEALAAKATADAAATALALGQSGTPTLPVAKADEQPVVKPGEVVPVVYNPTGDAGLDMLLETVGALGYTPDSPAMKAAILGDFSLISAELAVKGVKGHERLVALGEKCFADQRAKTVVKQAEDLKAVHNEAGGPEQWAAIQKWAATEADDGEKKAISEALGKGGLEARMAASWLRSNYERSTNVQTEGTGKPVSNGKGTPDASGVLSPQQYAKAVAEARVGFRGDFENSSVYKGLQARRLAWKA